MIIPLEGFSQQDPEQFKGEGVIDMPVPEGLMVSTVVIGGKKVGYRNLKEDKETVIRTRNLCPCPDCKLTENIAWSNKQQNKNLYCFTCDIEYDSKTGKEINFDVAEDTPKNKQNSNYTIDKDRVIQNGVKARSKNTTCGKIWELFDNDPTITSKDLTAIAEQNGWNRNNVSCEFYSWRKFNGISGRKSKKS